MRVYLIGYMAAGKSRLGRDLADYTGLAFTDLDDVFEERFRISIVDFFAKYNEDTFRKLEREILHESAELEDCIIATGGGTPCFFDNMQFIKQHGTSLYIRMNSGRLSARLKTIRRKRPLLSDLPPDDLEPFIQQQLQDREHFYLQADYILEGPDVSPETVVAMVPGLSRK